MDLLVIIGQVSLGGFHGSLQASQHPQDLLFVFDQAEGRHRLEKLPSFLADLVNFSSIVGGRWQDSVEFCRNFFDPVLKKRHEVSGGPEVRAELAAQGRRQLFHVDFLLS